MSDKLSEVLVGRTIRSVEIDKEEQGYLRLATDSGPVVLIAEGDCCSESWFYQIAGFDALLGHVVRQVEQVDMGDIDDGKTRQEFDQLYSVKIVTDGGHAEIEFRNSSNGYYGGWLSVEDGDVETRWNDKPIYYSSLKDDWQA